MRTAVALTPGPGMLAVALASTPGHRASGRASTRTSAVVNAGTQVQRQLREGRDEQYNDLHTIRAGPGTAGLGCARRNLVRARLRRRHRHECELHRAGVGR